MRVDILGQGGDSHRAWLSRLDLAALAQASGYRAEAIDPRDLWQTLEDPDANGALRAGAARVLVRADPIERIRKWG